MEISKKESCIVLLSLIILLSCTNKKNTEYKEEIPFFSVSMSEVKAEIEVPISNLIESLEIIQLENKDEAFSKIGVIYVTENYIGIQPSNQDAYKLFNKNGYYLGNVGEIGQGPGEYGPLYHSQIDEKYKRIYLVSFNAKNILTYDLKGNFLPKECIPLAVMLPKGICYIDNQQKTVTVLSLPFRGEQEMVCWTQDLNGTVLQSIPSTNYTVFPDYSNEIFSFNNMSSYDFQLAEFYQEKQDTLYHYDIGTNTVNPIFTLNAPIKAGELIYCYLELPFHYISFIKTIKMKVNPDNDIQSTRLILVDKKTQKAQYVRIINDYLGGWEFDPFYLSFRIRDGYFAYTMEPIELKELLEESLENKELTPDIRKRVTELNNKVNPNDNNVIMIGKLKQ